jgi:hypothetical protein
MSAFGGKADIGGMYAERLLLTQSRTFGPEESCHKAAYIEAP